MTDGTQSVAEILRERRKDAGRSIGDIAGELKIKTRYLEALEAGDYEQLPPPAFSAGFVRSYADALGLDGCALARDFRCEAGGDCDKPELNFPEPLAESRVPGRAVLLTGGAALLAVYFGWVANFGNSVAPDTAVTPVPDRLAGLTAGTANAAAAIDIDKAVFKQVVAAGDRASRTVSTDNGSSALQSQTEMTQAEKTVAEGDAVSAVAPSALESEAERDRTDSAAAVVAEDTGGQAIKVAGTGTGDADPATAETVKPRVMLKALTDTWFYVVDATDREVWNGVLHAGESWAPKADADGLRLMTSNAGALRVLVDGEDIGPLGDGGDVVRDILLTPDGLKTRENLAMR